jgi:ribosomal protein S18 acetylase RimI-like enzyme
MNVRIREYSDKDYEQVATVWRQCFSGTLRPIDSKEAMHRLVGHGGIFLVAEDGGKLVGTVFAGYDGRQATVHRLAVLPERQRKGIGRALMGELLSRLAKLKPIEVLAHADPEEHVVRIYEGYGFKHTDSVYMKRKVYE